LLLILALAKAAKRGADIRSDLGQASNAGQRQNQRNPGGREPFQYFNSLLGRIKKELRGRVSHCCSHCDRFLVSDRTTV
jgi:hypothetical protein